MRPMVGIVWLECFMCLSLQLLPEATPFADMWAIIGFLGKYVKPIGHFVSFAQFGPCEWPFVIKGKVFAWQWKHSFAWPPSIHVIVCGMCSHFDTEAEPFLRFVGAFSSGEFCGKKSVRSEVLKGKRVTYKFVSQQIGQKGRILVKIVCGQLKSKKSSETGFLWTTSLKYRKWHNCRVEVLSMKRHCFVTNLLQTEITRFLCDIVVISFSSTHFILYLCCKDSACDRRFLSFWSASILILRQEFLRDGVSCCNLKPLRSSKHQRSRLPTEFHLRYHLLIQANEVVWIWQWSRQIRRLARQHQRRPPEEK